MEILKILSKHYEKTNPPRKFYLSCFLMSLLCRDELSLRVRFGKRDLVIEQLDSSLILILVSETCIYFDVFTNIVIFILLYLKKYITNMSLM